MLLKQLEPICLQIQTFGLESELNLQRENLNLKADKTFSIIGVGVIQMVLRMVKIVLTSKNYEIGTGMM
jgi:hypothetical protein